MQGAQLGMSIFLLPIKRQVQIKRIRVCSDFRPITAECLIASVTQTTKFIIILLTLTFTVKCCSNTTIFWMKAGNFREGWNRLDYKFIYNNDCKISRQLDCKTLPNVSQVIYEVNKKLNATFYWMMPFEIRDRIQ